jgi:hypothetical protein
LAGLRELKDLEVVKSDFVLVHGDLVSNLNLQPLIQAHKDRLVTFFRRFVCVDICRARAAVCMRERTISAERIVHKGSGVRSWLQSGSVH